MNNLDQNTSDENPGSHGTVEDRLVQEVDAARVDGDRFVIVESFPYFVQLMPNHCTLYGEVISNRYLDGADRLTRSQEKRLVDLGWNPPETSCHPDCPSDLHPNFSMIWPADTPSRMIARDLLQGLVVTLAGRGEGAAEIIIKTSLRATTPSASAVPRH